MRDLKEKPVLLREKAELLIKNNSNIGEGAFNEDVLKLLHELEVYQIELEMQNEELLLAKENAEIISQKYTSLYDFAPMGYFTLDRKGLIMEINHNGAKMMDNEKNVLIGNNFRNFISPETQKYFKDFLVDVFECNYKVSCELKLISPVNREVYIHIEGIVTSAEDCLIAAFDVTERRRNEKTLVENEARLQELNATKDKFFSIIAHDLKGPFTSIIGFTELLLEQIHKKDFNNIEKITDIIYNSSVQAMDLLSNLLEWARLQTGKLIFSPGVIALDSLVDKAISILNPSILQKSIVVSKSFNQELKVFADPEMLSNVFRNLISNAIKFTPKGGTIKIEAEERPEALLLIIRDSGVGISDDNIKKLFRVDTVYSTKGTEKESGTGLGLLLCKEFIEKHGGQIWIESEPGWGSNFFFTLPSEKKPPTLNRLS